MRVCSVSDCGRDSRALGLCGVHYQRHRTGADLTAPVAERLPVGTQPRCSVPLCGRPGLSRHGSERICTSHEARLRRGMPDWRERPMPPMRFRSKHTPGGQTAEVRVILPLDLMHALDTVADARGLARATAAREAIEAWLRAARPNGRVQGDELEDSAAWARRAFELGESC